MLPEVETILGRKITAEDWNALWEESRRRIRKQ